MAKQDKYFYVSKTSSGWNARHTKQLVRWNSNFIVEVDEEVDYYQYINLTINSLNQNNIEPPVSSDFEKVKSIIKETFFDHYIIALKNVHEINAEEGECYILSHSKDWFIVRFFSKDEKRKQSIEIDFRNSVEGLGLMVFADKGHKHRPTSRKNGLVIDNNRFLQLLNLTIQFLHNPDSYLIFLEEYAKNFILLTDGKEKVQGFLNRIEKSFENIMTQLTLRKENVERRLIGNDTDTTLERARLRGEIDGLQYAITTLTKNS